MGLKQPEIIRSKTPVELGPPSDGGGRGLRATVYRFDANGKVIDVTGPDGLYMAHETANQGVR